MAIYYFTPPEFDEDGEPFPPFVFELSGQPKCVFAHRYWKPVKKPYEVMKIFDQWGRPVLDKRTGKEKVIMHSKTEWVLDDEMNAKMERGEVPKPDTAVGLSPSDWKMLQQERWQKFVAYMVPQGRIINEEKKNLEALRRQHAEEFEASKRALEEQKEQIALLRAKYDKELAELKKETAVVQRGKRD